MTILNPGLRDFSDQYPERFLQDDKDTLRDEAKFLDNVASLTERLPISIESTRFQYDLDFLPQPDGVYAYPDVLKDRLMTRELQGVSVTIVKEVDEPSTTSIEFTDEDGALYISRDSITPDPYASDAVVNKGEDPQGIGRVPDQEIQAFLLSLAGLYTESELQTASPSAPTIDATGVLGNLEKHAVSAKTFQEYQLDSGRSVRFNTTRTTKERMSHFTINYETGSDSTRLIAEITREFGLQIKFERVEDGLKSPFVPEGGDYVRLAEIIEEELQALGQKDPQISVSPEILGNIALKDDLANQLDQYGLDSSNPGTT